ncbi:MULTISPECIES: bifunctional diaminohydroxyphosphoribosylaminopyrimidine deaminase/5-amino-6-(5-phosphoribosylamino)uracil reductase RibD [unclassified Bacillus cereus group]|uniref:bifunctional diaminohydroxyphosphoribosylaminopyrimidine deaminase/5-amino-6-(5-phosphoribosylamino)uracil reductase RibD n=1 Tax=unclassified Bacillus cereus group TaxID=2750818 RepID=UPI0022E669CF|nr:MULTISPECIES: bifunctional diaminohydroxyphosphoribosylaminopyrimidine deaminase/5-amino-6-(5-phosphoribosylamino)uracil reductase RibD [unclassified Bacillus cereus group]MDA1648293.1 bifunctional diaminohydroxyphosphoribosylaminopyrimidine deaminase/5-amino-6-(5-phosphoribosylamino)uracil reductase RibD [Bacillus cereus group sp. TH160LC]MDA1803265.1 bifunctional diaminohydroxyphosphoribosylaminopyrimidine deaminase/5-amino-6-(5-phosphoribosylamino)uracil reductase RibD [Bacillus cereus grou
MTDQEYMRIALQLAKGTSGQTSPNPMVGAVVVKDGNIVGMGAHLRAGEEHAEVHALHMAGEKAKGATVYVTLEPCSHFGKTPPCCDLLLKKGVKRVVIATLDCNPLVSGNGKRRLEEAGIEVTTGVLEAEAVLLNRYFFHYMKTKRPFVTIKTAMSLDGKTATVTGESKWITGEEARADVHQYRHTHDAILVGVNTVIADNPHLTTRIPNGGQNPIRVILDTHLRTPPSSHVITDSLAPTWIMVGRDVNKEKIASYESENITIFQMKTKQIEIQDVLDLLGEKQILSLFVEGGQTVHANFLQTKYFNEIVTYISPKLIGGSNAPTLFGGNGFSTLQDALSLEIQEMKQIGNDIKIVANARSEVTECLQEL